MAKTTRRLAWDDNYYLQTFLMTKKGITEPKLRELIGASEPTWKGWKRKRPALRAALKQGREARRSVVETNPDHERVETFAEYVYGQLPTPMRRVWTEIEAINDGDDERQRHMKETLNEHGVPFRQALYLHALPTSRFNMTTALKKSMISLRTYEQWHRDYPDFVELVKEIKAHKQSYFENALMDAVQLGDTSAIIFANKTFNRDIGYGDKVTVEHTGNVTNTNITLDLTAALHDIPHEYKLLIIERLQRQQKAIADGADQLNVIDAKTHQPTEPSE